ncbi:MAG: MGMT family protein [Prevotellaceae bacterium]|jgi:methylated-DNA-protein-cysteine methyltransferase-like protein|nr:MGMT family protein [Prevotellaceae bacterium]
MATNSDLSFFEQVWELAKLIPRGRVTSYGAIARALGSAQSARMVGWAMNAAHGQPDVPAHRVVNRQGLLSGKIHFGAPDEMQRRLEAEGIMVINDRVVEFDKLFWEPLEELERETILPSPVEPRQ